MFIKYYDPFFKTRKSTAKPQKGQLCPNCGHINQFRKVNSNWINSDNSITLNNTYQILVCPFCGYRIYPVEMIQEYNELKRQKVLV